MDLFHPPLVRERLLRDLVAEVHNDDGRLATSALGVGRLVHPNLDVQPYLHRLDAMAGAADHEFTLAYGRLAPSADLSFIAGLTEWVFQRP